MCATKIEPREVRDGPSLWDASLKGAKESPFTQAPPLHVSPSTTRSMEELGAVLRDEW